MCIRIIPQLFIKEKRTNVQFLINCRSEVCVLPRHMVKSTSIKHENIKLIAANNLPIKTYGTTLFSSDLQLGRDLSFEFIVADVSRTIIVADFLHHFQLLVDTFNKKLVATIDFRSHKDSTKVAVSTVKTVKSKYEEVLIKYPEITDSTPTRIDSNNNITHRIITTGPGRRINASKYKVARNEFDRLL